jgi:hypothetical protein
MADTVPRHNQASVNLSLLLDDAVTGADNGIAAALDGTPFTAAKRNQYLHEAYRALAFKLVESFGIQAAADLVPGLITTQSITWVNTGVALNKDYLYPLSVYDAVGKSPFMLSKRASLDRDFLPYVNNFYTIEAGKIYGYQRTAGVLGVLNAGAVFFYYIKADRRNSTTGADVAINTAPDTVVDGWALDFCMRYAAALACEDKSIIDDDPAWLNKANRFKAMAMDLLPKAKIIP